MTKKSNTGLIVLALGAGAFLYWKYIYIGEGDMHAGRNYLTNRGLPATDADVRALFKLFGKDYVIRNQVQGGIISTPGTITTNPIYNIPPAATIPITSIVDTPVNYDWFDEFDFAV